MLVVDHQLGNNDLSHLFLWTESAQVFLVPGYHPPVVTEGERVVRMLVIFNLQFLLLRQCNSQIAHRVCISKRETFYAMIV
jgi:hypothetical protein